MFGRVVELMRFGGRRRRPCARNGLSPLEGLDTELGAARYGLWALARLFGISGFRRGFRRFEALSSHGLEALFILTVLTGLA